MQHQDRFQKAREAMVRKQIVGRGIRSQQILNAMYHVPRHWFVPPAYRSRAYEDRPLPIGAGQTISQPYMVAAMTYLLQLTGAENVLEIGTGSGYQAAVLSLLAHSVHTIERQPQLAQRARQLLENLGYSNVRVHIGDGSLGWPEAAPYQRILVTAAAPQIPEPLLEQLDENGLLVIPVGGQEGQDLQRWKKVSGKVYQETLFPVAFVPLRGHLGWQEDEWSEEES